MSKSAVVKNLKTSETSVVAFSKVLLAQDEDVENGAVYLVELPEGRQRCELVKLDTLKECNKLVASLSAYPPNPAARTKRTVTSDELPASLAKKASPLLTRKNTNASVSNSPATASPLLPRKNASSLNNSVLASVSNAPNASSKIKAGQLQGLIQSAQPPSKGIQIFLVLFFSLFLLFWYLPIIQGKENSERERMFQEKLAERDQVIKELQQSEDIKKAEYEKMKVMVASLQGLYSTTFKAFLF